jgi:mRNA interferase RelE/StbE
METALQVVIALSHDPRPANAKKLVGSQRDWRVRFGQHRVVCSIDDAGDEVTVFNVAKRSDAYR